MTSRCASWGSALVLWSLFSLLASCRSAAPTAPPLLEASPQQQIERHILRGHHHDYLLRLREPSFIRLVVQQKGVDVSLELIAPSGNVIARVNGPGGARSRELLAAVSDESGPHRLTITASATDGPGEYALTLLETRPREENDRPRVEGLLAYAQARQMYDRALARDEMLDALAAFRKAAAAFETAGDAGYRAWAQVFASDLLTKLERWEGARRLSREAAEIFSLPATENPSGRATALSNLARALVGLEDFERASEVFDEALAACKEVSDHRCTALNLNNRAGLFIEVGRLERAREDLSSAVELWTQLGDAEERITALINLGVVHRKLGEMNRALRRYEEAAKLAQVSGARSHEVHLLSALGRFHIATGELQRALSELHRGLDLAEELGASKIERAINSNLGLLYRILGRPTTGLVHYRRSLELSQSSGDLSEIAKSHLGLSALQSELGHDARALENLRAALRSSRRAGNPSIEASVRRELGLDLAARGRYEDALHELRAAQNLASGESTATNSSIRRSLAQVLDALGRDAEAIEMIEPALDFGLDVDAPLELGAVRYQLAGLYREQGDLDTALVHLEATVHLHETIRARMLDPTLRASFLGQRQDHYFDLVDLLIELAEIRRADAYTARALEVSERSRARALVEILTEANVDIRSRVSPELRQREDQLRNRLSLLYSDLLGGEQMTETGRERLRDSIRTTRQQYRRLETEIREIWREYSDLRYPEPLQAPDIRELIPDGTALLHYALGRNHSFLFVVQGTRLTVHRLAGAESIDEKVRQLRATLASTDPRAASRFRALSRELYRVLMEPAENELSDLARIWIVPDGSLFYLPFELLSNLAPRASGAAKLQWLVERWETGYAPSATVLSNLTRRHDSSGLSLVAFAGPVGPAVDGTSAEGESSRFRSLPGTVEEVERISLIFGNRAKTFVGEAAHQGNVAGNPIVQHARLLHFASHGIIREDQPTESGILLSPDPRGDTLLQVFEIFNLKLNAEAVILSACETGLGEMIRGEGLMGLSRAFFYSGASAVVVSLWPVADEATSELMQRFYTHVEEGHRVPEALRSAKLELLAEGTFSHPRYWAPFIHLGEMGGALPRNANVGKAASDPVTSVR